MAAAKTALITGCSQGGIGSALVQELQKRGVHVFATARNLSKMEHLAKLPGITLLELDVTSNASIQAALTLVTAQSNGKLDYLINNAGRNYFSPVTDMDENLADARAMFETNFFSAVAMCRAFAPLVINAKGTIVNNCSLCAHMNSPWMSEL
jgi:1-acylglycerone phosphate reductase